jgi:Domain of unknown function (DUF4954)/Domain of unknown function (DUF6819)
MNEIIKKPISSVGYQFIEEKYLPEGKDEYHLRNLQNKNGIHYRNLTAYEIEVLVRNNNTADNWNMFHVSDAFNPELVKNCKFYGLVRIGKLETISLEYHNVCMPVGLYSSTIISCDFGDNVIVNNVRYLSHYIIGNEVILLNVDELHVTNHSKFGNGIIKEGESESVRIWIEVCNENAGRKIMPFNGMLPGDAYLWSRYRDDEELLQKFKEFTEKKFDRQRGYYGMIGDRTVIKNTSIIKDVWIGSDAYIKGANKLKNLTINSSPEAPSQIGEGCELVNGIISNGCRIFYGVKAVRFMMGSNSQLKYGARLINSFLGDNSTISCCEVLNSLIFPGHEQHHNNSFLCASLVMGQSNVAAGATLGSNHNSRAADGELITARGFWPGLCVSLKHNSKFASFTLLAKGDYPYELNIRLPFSLVSNDVGNNQLTVMPAYWFMYNLYALARNEGKYLERDHRTNKLQLIEYNYLAPDSINEIFNALDLLKKYTAMSQDKNYFNDTSEAILLQAGESILEDQSTDIRSITINNAGFENSSRPVCIPKVREAYAIYKELVLYYGIKTLIDYINAHSIDSFHQLIQSLPPQPARLQWVNIGGQLLPVSSVQTLLKEIKNNDIRSWKDVHTFYEQNGKLYSDQKLQHAYASLLEVTGIEKLNPTEFKKLLFKALDIKEWMTRNIYESRAKDYQNEFRKMVYNSEEEMDNVIGKLDDNVFINLQKEELSKFRCSVEKIIGLYKL